MAERHPDEAPDPYRLADLAPLSPYRFHRVYRGTMGEAVAATSQRIRLHRAWVALPAGEQPLSRVAQRAIRRMDASSGETPGTFPMREEYPNDPRTPPADQLRTRIYLSRA